MNVADVWAQMEAELTWRHEELRFFRNQLLSLQSDSDRDLYRKALLLLLYAHFEGFCKAAFLIYVKAINDEKVSSSQVCYELAAASLHDVFRALANTDSKCAVFKNALPDDAKLHRFARERDFMEQLDGFWARIVDIPDTTVDTESNLWPIVLRKNLFRLGLPPDMFKDNEGAIAHLLNRRNNIAHGAERLGIREKVFEEIRTTVYGIMDELVLRLIEALSRKDYLRGTNAAAAAPAAHITPPVGP